MNLCGLQMEYHFNKITKLHAGGCGEAIIDMLSIELDCCYNTLQVAAVSHLYSLISGMPRLIGSDIHPWMQIFLYSIVDNIKCCLASEWHCQLHLQAAVKSVWHMQPWFFLWLMCRHRNLALTITDFLCVQQYSSVEKLQVGQVDNSAQLIDNFILWQGLKYTDGRIWYWGGARECHGFVIVPCHLGTGSVYLLIRSDVFFLILWWTGKMNAIPWTQWAMEFVCYFKLVISIHVYEYMTCECLDFIDEPSWVYSSLLPSSG